MAYPFSWTPSHITVTSPSQVTVFDNDGDLAVLSTGISTAGGIITFSLVSAGTYIVKVRSNNLELETAKFTVNTFGTTTPEFTTYEHITTQGLETFSNYVSLSDLLNPTSEARGILDDIFTGSASALPVGGIANQVVRKSADSASVIWSTLGKADVGLGNVDNTSDANKPISTAVQNALNDKANNVNPVFTGTVTGVTKSMVGLGNVDNTSDANKPVSSLQQTALNGKAPLNNPNFTGTVTGISKSMVGLGNVDNTSDMDKPVSTAQQAAINSATGGVNLSGLVAKASMPLNVKDYGAVGNGTTDDTAAIQAALNAVPAGGRGVYIPAGSYKITSALNVTKDGTMIFGDGTGNRMGATQNSIGTRLEPTAAVVGAAIVVQRTENDRPLQGVSLKEFTIDGQSLGTGIDGIIFRVNQGHMDKVHIFRMSGVGLRVKGYTTPAWDTYDSTFHNLLIGKCTSTGAILDTDSADTHWSHCIIYGNQDNLVLKGSSGQFTGCHFYDPVRHDIFFDGGGSRTKFANCKIEGLRDHMVKIDSTNGGYSDIQFTGCGFSSNNTGTTYLDNTWDYVNISGPSSAGIGRTTFVGNNFNIKGGTTLKPRYAISMVGSAVQGTVIIGNAFGPASHWGTAPINNAGSTSIPAIIKSNANVADVSTSTSVAAPYLNVLDYGAKADGSDDTAAIQAAINAIPATGGTVWFPAGNYRITSTLVVGNDNTTLRGSGAGSRFGSYSGQGTRISAMSSATAFTGPLIRIARPDATRAVYAPKLVDLAIDTQGVTTSAAGPIDGLVVTALRGDFDNVTVWSASGANIRLIGISSSFASTGNRFRSIVASQSATGFGVVADTNASDNTFSGCIFESNNRGAQLISGRTHFIGCDFSSNTLSNAYITDGGTATRFVSCKFRNASNHGVELITVASGISDVSFLGCNFEGNGTATNNTYDHLWAGGSSSFAVSRLSVVACNFISSAANKPRYGINLASNAVQNAQIVGNTFGTATHFATSAYNNASNSSLKNRVVGNINVADVINTTTATADYTLTAADANGHVDINMATAVVVTVPTNATAPMPIGTVIKVAQIGAGQVLINPASGVTINTAKTYSTRAQYSVIELRKRNTDIWVLSGDLT